MRCLNRDQTSGTGPVGEGLQAVEVEALGLEFPLLLVHLLLAELQHADGDDEHDHGGAEGDCRLQDVLGGRDEQLHLPAATWEKVKVSESVRRVRDVQLHWDYNYKKQPKPKPEQNRLIIGKHAYGFIELMHAFMHDA